MQVSDCKHRVASVSDPQGGSRAESTQRPPPRSPSLLLIRRPGGIHHRRGNPQHAHSSTRPHLKRRTGEQTDRQTTGDRLEKRTTTALFGTRAASSLCLHRLVLSPSPPSSPLPALSLLCVVLLVRRCCWLPPSCRSSRRPAAAAQRSAASSLSLRLRFAWAGLAFRCRRSRSCTSDQHTQTEQAGGDGETTTTRANHSRSSTVHERPCALPTQTTTTDSGRAAQSPQPHCTVRSPRIARHQAHPPGASRIPCPLLQQTPLLLLLPLSPP